MARPIVSAYIAVSLDGFIAREDGGLDWLGRVHGDPGEDYGYRDFFDAIDAVVVGRNTYDAVLGFEDWPFAGKQVTVLTHRPLDALHGESAHDGVLAPLLDDLGLRAVRRVYLDGGIAIRQGLAEGLVDDLTLSWIPVLLGRGRPLFGPEVAECDWQLVATAGFPSGLVQTRYRRAARQGVSPAP